ncbi:hypothetical protein GH714_026978 [Hevea brasiliensis]|uniref:Uncharacterized protein n=1 Tax=Hevea brasiliensis TaxID=3981 RepID=A0A6A6LVB3_HEVBR|nr:hypothetical protein GH714_026978 [Hevea brasiliensis]
MSNGADCCIPMPNGKDDQNKKGWKFYAFFVGSIVFSCIIFGLLIASLKVDGLQNCKIWDFELWKWCVLLLVVLCGGLTVYLFLLALESLIIEKFLSELGFLFDRGDNKQNEDKKKTVNGATRGRHNEVYNNRVIDAIRNKKLPNLCYEKKEITDENTAANTANEIFKKFERGDDERYMDMDDLLKHIPADVDDYKHFKAVAEKKQKDEGEQIKRSVFRSWVVSLYNSYDSVNSALKQRKTAVDELNKLASVIALVIIIIVWLLFMEYLSTKMIVDEMEILKTTFLKYDNEKIYYPNSVLATKPISNLYRSPSMSDSFEFAIDLHTSKEKIKNLQESIKKYMEGNPRRWSPASHSLQFKEIEDMNKLKVALYFKHTINFHDVGKRSKRRSELVLRMKIFFENLDIKYYPLPQKVHLVYGACLGNSTSHPSAVQRRSFSF